MPAPLGNQFWKLRAKHGRDKLFATPELLWEAACEYFQWVDEHPLESYEQRKGNVIIPKGHDGELPDPIITIPRPRPYTLEAFCLYCQCSTGYFRAFKTTEACTKDFLSVITHIEQTVYNQKFEGASSGLFNHNIIARSLGLRDGQDVTTDGEKIKFDVSLKL